MAPLRASWKRLDYLAHRWIGIILGSLVFVWFASGIVMVFYPWPAYTESQRLALLSPLEPASSLVGFRRASAVAIDALHHADIAGVHAVGPPVRARLMRWGDRLVYQFWGDQGGRFVPAALVDAATGASLSPVTSAMATDAARAAVGPGSPMSAIDRLAVGDHYMMNNDYAAEFPAYRVQFADPARSAVSVSVRDGDPFGVVTTRTRLTTWFGTVPHWFYFQWLYDRHSVWNAVNIVMTSIGTLLALTGIVFGLAQLRLRRTRGAWPTPYRGVSRWHHLAGLVFGIIVLTWTFSAIWQNLGSDNLPRTGQDARARGGDVHWDEITVPETQAVARVRQSTSDSAPLLAIDLVQLQGEPGYALHLADGNEYWVDAVTGDMRGEMTPTEALRVARSIAPGAPPHSVGRIHRYDFYYYARPGREMHLPAWRVQFADRERTTVYLDAVSGTPVGFVDGGARRTRWLRDALHSFDYPVLNQRRWLWYLVVLPLLLGGLLSTGTGVVLLVRRTRAMQRRRVLARSPVLAASRSDHVPAESP